MTAIFSLCAALHYGITLVNVPIEYVNFLAGKAGFDPENPTIVSLVTTAVSVGAALAQFTLSFFRRLAVRTQFILFILIVVVANVFAI